MTAIINIDEHTDVYGIKWKKRTYYPGLDEFLTRDVLVCSGTWATFFKNYYNIKKVDEHWIIKIFSYGKLKSIIHSKSLIDKHLESIILSARNFILSIDMDVLDVKTVKRILGYIPSYFEFGKTTLEELKLLVNTIMDISKPTYIGIFGLLSFEEMEKVVDMLLPEYKHEKIEKISEDTNEKIYSKMDLLKVLEQKSLPKAYIYFSYPHIDILFIPILRNYVRNFLSRFLSRHDNFS